MRYKKNPLVINAVKSYIKRFPYIFKFTIFMMQISARVIDFLFIPIAIFYNRKGLNVFEVPTRSFGHHLAEPVAVAVLNLSKKKNDQKKLLLLANEEKAYVKYTNTLLKQKFKIIKKYSFLNIYYWLARSRYCGLSRSSIARTGLNFFYEIHFKYRHQLDIFDHSELQDDDLINNLFQELNPDNRFVVLWKPKIHRGDKYSSYSTLRYSSLNSCKPLFDKIYEEGGIVFGLLYGEAEFKHHNVIDLRDIKDNHIREKFVFYLDLNCKLAIVGQNGGTVPVHIFKKPFMVYDVSYPYTLHFMGPKTIISLKEAKYNNGEAVRIEDLVKLNLNDIKKIIKNKKVIFTPNSSEDIIELYEELKIRMKNNFLEFSEDGYKMNVEWGDNIPRNVYNTIGYSQVANCCYQKQYKSLAPKHLLEKSKSQN